MTTQGAPAAPTGSDFPALYQAADQNSLDGQRRFLNATRLRLIALIGAATFGAVAWRKNDTDISGIFAVAALGIALISELYLLRSRPDRIWFNGRAVAESAKTLAWRYSVGGAPFPIGAMAEKAARKLLLDRLSEIARKTPGEHLVPVADAHGQITPWMDHIRGLPLENRRPTYLTGRIIEQHAWYSTKAKSSEEQSVLWGIVLACVEASALIAAVLRAAALIRLDVLGIAGAVIAGGVAWVETKQHNNLASAYALAAQELAEIASQDRVPETEASWCRFVDQAEEAISREHTMWRASHS